jgi:hypothetical protein
MLEYTIDGNRVTCALDDGGQRVWRCGCVEYHRCLLQYGKGFCVHIAIAIEKAIADRLVRMDFP